MKKPYNVLKAKWEGPYIVEKALGKIYQIKPAPGCSGNKTKIVSFDSLKPSQDWQAIQENTKIQRNAKRKLSSSDFRYTDSDSTSSTDSLSSDETTNKRMRTRGILNRKCKQKQNSHKIIPKTTLFDNLAFSNQVTAHESTQEELTSQNNQQETANVNGPEEDTTSEQETSGNANPEDSSASSAPEYHITYDPPEQPRHQERIDPRIMDLLPPVVQRRPVSPIHVRQRRPTLIVVSDDEVQDDQNNNNNDIEPQHEEDRPSATRTSGRQIQPPIRLGYSVRGGQPETRLRRPPPVLERLQQVTSDQLDNHSYQLQLARIFTEGFLSNKLLLG